MSESDLTANFYSSPNEVDPSQLNGAAAELLTALRARLVNALQRTVLPARVHSVTRWYGIAPSDRESRFLREELRCWLGPPIAARSLDARSSSDPVDQQAVRLAGPGTAIRVDVADGWQAKARENVASLTDVWSLAPERGVDQPRPVGRLLRQFYESVLAADRAAAESSLDEIKARSLLSATNIRFLRLELLSSLGTPEEIRDDASLRDISHLARPPAVTEGLAAAADALFIEPALARGGDSDWAGVAKSLDETWPGLVTHIRQVSNAATARCLALSELLSPTPNSSGLAELPQRFPTDPFLAAVAPAAASDVVSPPTTSAIDLYHERDYWGALDAAHTSSTDRASAAVALAAAMNLGDSSSAVRALAIVDRLDGQDRDQLLATSVERTFYEQLLSQTSDAQIPSGWLDWLRGQWVDRPDLLSEWSGQWLRTPETLEREAGAIAEELLDALNDARRGRVRNGVPIFVDWLVGSGLPASGVDLATTVFDILMSSEPGRIERQAGLAVLEEVLSAGCTRQQYAELVDAVSAQLPIIGPRDAPWLAQCLELFLLFSSYDSARRAGLFAEALGVAAAWAARSEAADLAVLELVFADGGLTLAPPVTQVDQSTVAPLRPFATVGIYSLRESATRVAADWIRRLFPTVEVRTSSEHVNSSSLSALARGSDVMIVQTSHAKHAATHAIEAAIADPDRLLLVHGRGASALVRALLAWAAVGC